RSARSHCAARPGRRPGGAPGLAAALLQIGVWYVDDPERTASLTSWQGFAGRAVLIHGLIALSYVLWPKKPKGEGEGNPPEAAAGAGAGKDAVRPVEDRAGR
ncbi:hypothetical protein ACFV5M_23930, partial [Streptomyces albidoflavus]